MKKFILFLTVLLTTQIWAKCNVYIPAKEFNHSGYSIYFNFDKLLMEKGYYQINNPEDADFILLIEGIETQGTFHKAVTKMTMGSYQGSHSITCFTQYCGISDFARSFNRSFKKLDKELKACE